MNWRPFFIICFRVILSSEKVFDKKVSLLQKVTLIFSYYSLHSWRQMKAKRSCPPCPHLASTTQMMHGSLRLQRQMVRLMRDVLVAVSTRREWKCVSVYLKFLQLLFQLERLRNTNFLELPCMGSYSHFYWNTKKMSLAPHWVSWASWTSGFQNLPALRNFQHSKDSHLDFPLIQCHVSKSVYNVMSLRFSTNFILCKQECQHYIFQQNFILLFSISKSKLLADGS